MRTVLAVALLGMNLVGCNKSDPPYYVKPAQWCESFCKNAGGVGAYDPGASFISTTCSDGAHDYESHERACEGHGSVTDRHLVTPSDWCACVRGGSKFGDNR